MTTREEWIAREDAQRLRSLLGAPESRVPEPLGAADEAILAGLLAEIHADARADDAWTNDDWTNDEATPARPRRWASAPVRIAAAAVFAVALVGAGLAWQSHGTKAEAGPPPVLSFSGGTAADALAGTLPSAHDTLTAVARSAAAQPAVRGSGVQRIQSYAWYLTLDAPRTSAEVAPTFTDLQTAPDGSVVSRETRAPALDLHGNVIDADHYPLGGAATVDRLPAGTSDPHYAEHLPRDPAALRDAFLADDPACRASATEEARCVYYAIVDLYGRVVVPPDLTAAVWSMLADEPTARDLGTTRDRVGRDGDAIVLRGDDVTDALRLLVLDPTTGQLLSWELVGTGLPGAAFDEPTVTSFQAITSASWVPEQQ
ncbi:MAG: CU044_5270 family protein [Brevundimonas sp.]